MPVQHYPIEVSTSPVVALHSSASNGRQWKHLANDLEGRFEVIAPDLPGYRSLAACQTSKGEPIDPIIAEIEELGEAVHLVGHSNGGAVAIKIALLRPDLIRSLTLYEPATFHFLAHGNERNRELFREIRQLSGLLTASAAVGCPQEAMETFIDFWNGKGFWHQLTQPSREGLAGMVNPVMRDFSEGFAQTWTLEDLNKLDFPTLVMMGLESPAVAQQAAIEVANAIPGSRIALLPELDHMAPIFQPEWVNPRILEHLSNAERPQREFEWPIKRAA